MATSKTRRHFEQVPLEKIQLEKIQEDTVARASKKRGSETRSSNVVFEAPEKKTHPYSVQAGNVPESRG